MTITLSQLRRAQDDGAIRGATLRAEGGGFLLVVHTRKGDRQYVETKKVDGCHEARRFVDAQTALRLLHKAGVCSIKVDLTSWTPDQSAERTPANKARSEYLRSVHATAKAVVEMTAKSAGNAQRENSQSPETTHSTISDVGPTGGEPVHHVVFENSGNPPKNSQAQETDLITDGRAENKRPSSIKFEVRRRRRPTNPGSQS
jgi:hypothetical protein